MTLDDPLIAETVSRQIHSAFANHGIRPAHLQEMMPVHDLAKKLIGSQVASPSVLLQVQSLSGTAVFVTSEERELTGVLAFMLLNAAGDAAVQSGQFNAASPSLSHVACRSDRVISSYGWGVCATNKVAAKSLLVASQELAKTILGGVPAYARPTTEAGQRVMRDRLGYEDLAGSAGLVWLPPSLQFKPATAA